VPSRPKEEPPTSASIAEKVQSILASKGLTLYRVSQESERLYGRSSPCFLPHNLYYDLRNERFRPSVHQIFTLSRITGFRFRDWLQIFGFDIENITRVQVLLPSKRTIVLDTSLTDRNGWTRWVRNRASREAVPPIAPLSQLLERASARRIGSVSEDNQRFLYAKVGREDALVFPDLVPGSIVRVDRNVGIDVSRKHESELSDRIFLVEHSKGFCCCRIRSPENGVIVPFADGLSYVQVALHHPGEVRVWGAVDFEFRPLLGVEEPHVPKDLARRWKPQLLPEQQGFGQLLKAVRHRLRVSTREAAQTSRTIAELLKDGRYTMSSSSLSDYELSNTPPRDFHKIITLCAIYGLHFQSVMRGIGINVAESGTEPMPERYLTRSEHALTVKQFDETVRTGLLERLLNECENEVPFFLRDVLGYFSESGHPSLDDFFWTGGDHDPLHPYLANSSLIVLNRRRKAPVHFASKPIWQQPIFMILRRGGRYLAASCGVENNTLVVHPYGPDFHPSVEYRLHRDAEIVGQIVAIARRFP
jgi:hypothetical protein